MYVYVDRYLVPSLMDFPHIPITKQFDVMAVTETWLTFQISSDTLHIDELSFHTRDRTGRGGGIGVFVKSELQSEVLDIPEFDADEVEMWLQINIGKNRTLLGAIYRLPKKSVEKFLTITFITTLS